MTFDKPERIAKVMARAGLCSRRDAEKWILDGRVVINGHVIETPALTVSSQDIIFVDGKEIPHQEKTRLWLYHKPKGVLTTAKDPQKRPTVFENLPRNLPRVISVGRLDLNSEGLLLLTNSGELAKHLTDPVSGYERVYRVRCRGALTESTLKILQKGVTIDEMRYAPIKVTVDRVQGGNSWLTLTLTEGKNREIRKILEHFDHPVNRLIRISYGNFHLGDLKPWAVEEVDIPEELLKFLKIDLTS